MANGKKEGKPRKNRKNTVKRLKTIKSNREIIKKIKESI